MKLSIIIWYFDNLSVLKTTYNSIIAQTYENVEIIIVNDSDNKNNNEEFISLFNELSKKHNVIIISNLKSQGLAAAWNIGKKHATGKYIWFFQEGNVLVKNDVIQKMMNNENVINNNPDVIECIINTFNTSDKQQPSFNKCLEKNKILQLEEKKEILVYANINIYTKIFRLAVIQNNNLNFRCYFNYNLLFIYQFLVNAKTFLYLDIYALNIYEKVLEYSVLDLLKQWPHIFNYFNSISDNSDYSEELIYSFMKYVTFTYLNMIKKYKNKNLNKKSFVWIDKRVHKKLNLFYNNKYINYNVNDEFNPYSPNVEEYLKKMFKLLI